MDNAGPRGILGLPPWHASGVAPAQLTRVSQNPRLKEQMRLLVAAQTVGDAVGGPVGSAVDQEDAFAVPGMGVEESFGVMSEKALATW
eukprot:scaffold14636_cov19-Tisochrysis_lutea.AAC.3